MNFRFLTIALSASLVVSQAHSAPVHVWSHHFGAPTYVQISSRVVTDPAGNIYILGYFGGTINLGGGPRVAADSQDNFVVSFDANGAYRWDIQYTTASVGAISENPAGGIVIGGSFKNTLNLGGTILTSAEDFDCFVAKLDADGHYGLRTRVGGLGVQTCSGVACDASGNVVLTGQFDVPGGAHYYREYFARKLDPSGNQLWNKFVFSGNYVTGTFAAFDPTGNVIIGAHYSEQYLGVDFGGGPFFSTQNASAALIKYAADGTYLWSRGLGVAGEAHATCLDVDAQGNVWLTGWFGEDFDFGAGKFTSSSNYDAFVLSFDPDGQVRSSQQIGDGPGNEFDVQYCNSVAVNPAGDAFVAGDFVANIGLGGGVFSTPGLWDGFAAKYTGTMDHVWSQQTNVDGALWVQGVAIDHQGAIILAGWFQGSVDLGGGVMQAGAGQDLFVAKLLDTTVPVLFSRFTAIPRGSDVKLDWDFSHDEALRDFTLYRREASAAQPVVVATGDANTTRSYLDTSVEPGRTYHFELAIRTVDGDTFRSAMATVVLPRLETSLGPNFPNPFNPRTTIEYTVGEQIPVTIEIHDISGALVMRLDQGVRAPGQYRVEWDGRNATGQPVASGVYFYQFGGASHVAARKLTLLK